MGAKMAAKYNCVLILVMSLDRSQMIISALQCRLECEPGYVAQRTPLITCVKGKYAKGCHHLQTYSTASHYQLMKMIPRNIHCTAGVCI